MKICFAFLLTFSIFYVIIFSMFIRTKKSPNTNKISVQIVKNVRKDGKVRQVIVRHIGMAKDEEELKHFIRLAEFIKAELENEHQPSLFSPEELALEAIRAREKKEKEEEEKLPVNLKELREEERVIVGIHEVYESIYRRLGFHTLFNSISRKIAMNKALYNIVMARTASPASKLKSVKLLEENFGIHLRVDTVYEMMDMMDEEFIEKLKEKTYRAAIKLLDNKFDVVFYDCTTLYFESFEEDELKRNGYSKDMKFNQVQVLLALLVTKEGIPVSYEVYAGNTFEGNTLANVIEELKKKYDIGNVIFVADSAMLSKSNLKLLEENNQGYIVGARLKSLPKELKEKILDRSNYIKGEAGYEYGCFELEDGRRLIVTYSERRALKDRMDREKGIERLKKKIARSENPVTLISNYGYRKFLKLEGESKVSIDEEKLLEESLWDGLHGVITNNKELEVENVVSQYKGLWQVEETFRVSKHDLKIRPVYHWTPRRVRAHIAICFMALCCVRHLEFMVSGLYKKLSPEVIRNELLNVQISILKDTKTGKRYAVPSAATENARRIYKVVNKTLSTVPFEIN